MSDTTTTLTRKIHSAEDLKSVVSTMKAIATIGVGMYEDSVVAQRDYTHTVLLGLLNCLRLRADDASTNMLTAARKKGAVAAVVFGSDQGLVGQFNENLANYVVSKLAELPGEKKLWAVGERIYARLGECGQTPGGSFALPNAIAAITPLVGEILTELESLYEVGEISEVFLYYNRPTDNGIYEQTFIRLLPLDKQWRENILRMSWPGKKLPEVLGEPRSTLLNLVHEFLFVTLFRACAESLASENASRLAAMHRAEKNIGELLETMHQQFHQLRQSSIDEELFDLISGAEALKFS